MSEDRHSLTSREFAKLLVQHQPRVTLYIRSLVFRKSDVDDLMQEVAAKAWEQHESFDTQRSFEAWLIAIAKFEVLSYMRDRKRSRVVFDESVVDALSDTLGEMSERKQLPTLEALERCLARVPREDRELLRQRFELDKTGQAIAQALDVSGATVSRRLQRIYSQLLVCMRSAMREGAAT